MPATLFLQSAVQDPYTLYNEMLSENPVYWDEANQLWAVYSYAACASILTNKSAHIPAINQNNKDGLNEHALLITNNLARLSSDEEHIIARQIAMQLFQKMKTVSIAGIAESLLNNNGEECIDWVNKICKKLPVLVVLKSFGFDDEAADFISGKMHLLVMIMLPAKTPEQVIQINETARQVYDLTEKFLIDTGLHYTIIKSLQEEYNTGRSKIITACISNLIGLIIQSYDAGKGVLSNSLLQIINNSKGLKYILTDKIFTEKSVIEALRFDPPVQNTRRVAAENFLVNNIEIKKGQLLLVVIAAANRDAQKFNHSNKYDIERNNNNEHLTFGTGHHECIAKYFSVQLAVETLLYFFDRYKNIKLLPQEIDYEPAINVRLPKQLLIYL